MARLPIGKNHQPSGMWDLYFEIKSKGGYVRPHRNVTRMVVAFGAVALAAAAGLGVCLYFGKVAKLGMIVSGASLGGSTVLAIVAGVRRWALKKKISKQLQMLDRRWKDFAMDAFWVEFQQAEHPKCTKVKNVDFPILKKANRYFGLGIERFKEIRMSDPVLTQLVNRGGYMNEYRLFSAVKSLALVVAVGALTTFATLITVKGKGVAYQAALLSSEAMLGSAMLIGISASLRARHLKEKVYKVLFGARSDKGDHAQFSKLARYQEFYGFEIDRFRSLELQIKDLTSTDGYRTTYTKNLKLRKLMGAIATAALAVVGGLAAYYFGKRALFIAKLGMIVSGSIAGGALSISLAAHLRARHFRNQARKMVRATMPDRVQAEHTHAPVERKGRLATLLASLMTMVTIVEKLDQFYDFRMNPGGKRTRAQIEKELGLDPSRLAESNPKKYYYEVPGGGELFTYQQELLQRADRAKFMKCFGLSEEGMGQFSNKV